MTSDDSIDLENRLSNISFLNGRTYYMNMSSALLTINRQLERGFGSRFDGVRLDTATNRSSVMRKAQYLAYERDFGIPIPLRPPANKSLKGIGVHGQVLSEVTIQIPFRSLGMKIDVDFSILYEEVPSLLSYKDMI